MRDLRERYPNELVVIGVHSAKFTNEQLTANIRSAILRHDIRHPVVNDARFEIWQSYAVRAWPTLVLIDPNGKIVSTESGEIQAGEYAEVIERLIADFDAQGLLDHTPTSYSYEKEAQPNQTLRFPSKLHISPDGRFFVADTGGHRILELKLPEDGLSAEVISIYGSGEPGWADGPAGSARFHNPHGMALLGEILYVADTDNHMVRAIDLPSGNVRTVAGTGQIGKGPIRSNDPRQISLRSPWAVLAVDQATHEGEPVVFAAMAGSHQIWALLGETRLGVFAGSGYETLHDGSLAEAGFNQPSDLALGLNHLLVADAEASAIRAISLGADGRVFTLVGQGLFEFGDVDGIGPEVRLQHPTGLAFDEGPHLALPTVFIADSYNNKIKTLDPTTGRVATLAGTGQTGYQDGDFATATFYQPEGVAAYQNRLYIADTNNHHIRVADLKTRRVHTLQL